MWCCRESGDELQRREPLHKNSKDRSSLCNLSVLCDSVVSSRYEIVNHRDTENTEVAQRNQSGDVLCKAALLKQADAVTVDHGKVLINEMAVPAVVHR